MHNWTHNTKLHIKLNKLNIATFGLPYLGWFSIVYQSGYSDMQIRGDCYWKDIYFVDTRIRSDWVSAYPPIFRGFFKVAGYFAVKVVLHHVNDQLQRAHCHHTIYINVAHWLASHTEGRNSPFYSYGWKWGWSWHCLDTTPPALLCKSCCS